MIKAMSSLAWHPEKHWSWRGVLSSSVPVVAPKDFKVFGHLQSALKHRMPIRRHRTIRTTQEAEEATD